MSEAYARYRERMSEIQALNSALSLLSWDQETLMPPRSKAPRSASPDMAAAGLRGEPPVPPRAWPR